MNSTIINKKKRCINCGNVDYWFSKKMCKSCSIIINTKNRITRFKNEQNTEDESFRNLIDDLDLVFSRYIRLIYSDNEGNCECYTCNKMQHYTILQCGHYIPRASLMTRFLEQNCRPQCKECNEYKSGNLEHFTEKLENEQIGITYWLLEQSRQIIKPTRDEIKHLLNEYKNKLKIITLKLNKK